MTTKRRWRCAAAVAGLALTVIAAPTVAHAEDDDDDGSGGGYSSAQQLPAWLLALLAKFHGDSVVGTLWGDVSPEQEQKSLKPNGTWSASRDVGSLYSMAERKGIHDVWKAGTTGKGITVAVIDTGIARVRGLTGKNKVINGPDLSFDGQSPGTRYLDGFGHGTHMAGIIAGRDPKWDRQGPEPGVFAGVAPDAQLLNMKVGAADGGVDVTQVIAAINWVVKHRTDHRMNVRVISLAYGTQSTQSWQVDPLARAVEDAQRAGIVVVASAGNDGLGSSQLLMPAVDPHVIAVGAADAQGTRSVTDDTVADFTSGGSIERRPDFLAPGRSIVSLRVPGSYADVLSPGGLVTGDATGRFFRGSGTSQATAFVAGEAALMLQKRPSLSPAQVKTLLTSTARPLIEAEPAMGAGETRAVLARTAPRPTVVSLLPASTGTGTLEASRGGEHVVDPVSGVALSGEVDVLGTPWNASAWAAASADGSAWRGGSWNNRKWTGKSFDANSWRSTLWSGTSWGGVPWADHRNAATWKAGGWKGQNWEARSWRSDSWEARSWRSLY